MFLGEVTDQGLPGDRGYIGKQEFADRGRGQQNGPHTQLEYSPKPPKPKEWSTF